MIYLKVLVYYFIKNCLYTFTCFLNNTLLNFFLINLLITIKNSNIINIYLIILYLKAVIISLKTNELIINSALLVGFNNVHPFLFYISLVLSFFYLVTLGNFIKCLLFSINSIIILSLLLGGLWGAGNSSWGFFWLKDPIEIILLSLFLLIVLVIHNNYNYKIIYNVIIYFYLVALALYCLRNGFFFTKHNFFNINLIKNIFLYYFFILFFNINKNLLLLLLLITVNNFFLIHLIIYFVFKTIAIYNSKIKLTHITTIAIYISWIKYKENNFSAYNCITNSQNLINYYYWSLTKNYNFIEFYKLKCLNSLGYSNFFLYSYKFFFFICVNMSYYYYLILIIFLISNLKIVSK